MTDFLQKLKSLFQKDPDHKFSWGDFFKKSAKDFVNFLRKGGWLLLVLFFADLISKLVVWKGCYDLLWEKHVPIISDANGNNILGLTLVFNDGMGYGFLSGERVLLATLSGVVGIGLILYLAYKFDRKQPLLRYALYLLIAGDFGNFIDRAFYADGVVDFIEVGNSTWPQMFTYVCNLADIWLTVGVVLLVIALIVEGIKEYLTIKDKKEKETAQAPATTEAESKSDTDLETLKKELSEDPDQKEKKSDEN